MGVSVNLGWKLAAVLHRRVASALLDTYEAERRPAAERVIMHSRAQLALLRPGAEVTALREVFSELLGDPDLVRRLSDLVSGADNCCAAGPEAHPLVGRWVPDFAIAIAIANANANATKRVGELARDGRPLLVDLTDHRGVAAAAAHIEDQVTVAAGRPLVDVSATAVLVRPDGYVAWASSAPTPDIDDLRSVLKHWFGINGDR
jgi:FAD binding domain